MPTFLLRLAALILTALPERAAAAGPLGDASEINVGSEGTDLKEVIINVTKRVLDFVSLLAVVVIVIAGIWLIVGAWEEGSKEKAKKIVIYTIVGLLLILIARAIVAFIIGLF
jgi:type IV secretory pathway VirB2 component (pilin)